MKVKENLKVFKESLAETVVMSKKEFLLITAVCILSGVVFGLLFSPRKDVMIGCLNGNSSANNHENSLRKAEEKTDAQKIKKGSNGKNQ